MLAATLVIAFLVLVVWLSSSTRDDAKTVLKAAQADIACAYDSLSKDKPDIARAKAFLGRWV